MILRALILDEGAVGGIAQQASIGQSPRHSPVLGHQSEHADTIEVTIADRGPGIPTEQVEQAFTPFRRLEGSRNRESGGVGLGLSIARDVVHGHGGSITLEAHQPTGLLVRVRLPKPHAVR